MSPDEAKQLILKEGLSQDAIAVCVRMGDDPGQERLAAVIEALGIVIAATGSEPALERELMLALWSIAYYGETQAESWQANQRWRDGQYNAQIAEIGLLVEEFIAGDRPT